MEHNITNGSTTDRTWPENAQERNDFSDWQYEVTNGDTVLGFRDWIMHRDEAEDCDVEGGVIITHYPGKIYLDLETGEFTGTAEQED